MIAYINGTLIDRAPGLCTLLVGGIGYEIEMSLNEWQQLPPVNHELSLYVQAIYREDAQLLFGFKTKAQKEAFQVLIKASGVGPKMALQVLDCYTVESLSLLISQGNHMALTRVKGIGPKLAKRLVIDLKGKIIYQSHPEQALQSVAQLDEAVTALVKLGFKEAKAQELVQGATGLSVEEIIKHALQASGGK